MIRKFVASVFLDGQPFVEGFGSEEEAFAWLAGWRDAVDRLGIDGGRLTGMSVNGSYYSSITGDRMPGSLRAVTR
jgi:hypothetical protein